MPHSRGHYDSSSLRNSGCLGRASGGGAAMHMPSRRCRRARIKVERPEGDFARDYDHIVHGESANFVWLNRGKQSVVLDLGKSEDKAVLEAMLAKADVF